MRMPQLWRARAQHAAPAAACALARKRARRQRVGSLAARAHTARTPQGTPPRLSRPTRGAAQHGGAAWPWWRWGARAAAHLGLDHCIDARPVCAFGCHCRWRRGGLPISRRARGRASTGRPCARRSCRDALRLRSCVARAPALAPALLPCDVPAGEKRCPNFKLGVEILETAAVRQTEWGKTESGEITREKGTRSPHRPSGCLWRVSPARTPLACRDATFGWSWGQRRSSQTQRID